MVDKIPGYAEVKYNKKDETAYISAKFSAITGIDVVSEVVDDFDYKKIMTELVSSPSDAGSDVYMAARPECWVRVSTFENEFYEFTAVTDVSEYVSCHNIIKSLKYYDSDTGLLCRDAFIAKVRSAAESQRGTIGLVSILISGVDRVSSFKGATAADKVVIKAASVIKKYENPHNAFGGRTSTVEMCLLLTDTYDDGCRKYAEKLLNGLSEALGSIDNSEYIRVYCGYALFGKEETDANAMLSAADYAVYEAKSSASSAPVRFDQANYVLKAYDFKKIQVFNTVVAENKLDYHFQPVVDSHTGEIFGYEALMRPREIDGVRLTPTEVITIAKEQKMNDRIEYLTLSNLLKFLSESISFFNGKRLFINTIPNCFIQDEEYEMLFEKYGEVFDKLIIEITEGSQITPESIELMRSRYSSKHALFALDDYGTGYANDSTLLSIQPDFIKIDRSLVADIDTDVQKRHLVGNMINFAKNHGIKTLGEGVETKGELETLISLGIDYIQGFYTSKPNPIILAEIASDIKNEIVDINIKNAGYKKKGIRIEGAQQVDITALAVQGYTDITAAHSEVLFTGDAMRSVSMCISCDDGYSGTISIENVNIFGLEAPVLTLGKNCDVVLDVKGSCTFGYEGIRVPESSRLTIRGSGNMKIDVNSDDGVVIGGNYLQDFGEIILEHEGVLDISVDTSNIIAVGGGVGGEKSSVEFRSGTVKGELRGINVIGAGAASGNVRVKNQGGKFSFDGAGRNVVGIGSFNGKAEIENNSDVKLVCAGDTCCGVGTLEGGSGRIVMNGGISNFTVNAKYATAIGAVSGRTDVVVNGGDYIISCEGNDAVGIGDSHGSGNVEIRSGRMKIRSAASAELCIGSDKGSSVIYSGNIIYDGRGMVRAYGPCGEVLEHYRVPDKNFSSTITSGSESYTYTAEAFDGEACVEVYLPVGTE